MQKHIVLSVIANDRPGIVEDLSNCIQGHHGNWLQSSLSELAGQFAGIVQVDIDAAHIDELKLALNQITDLSIHVVESMNAADDKAPRISITVTANDRPGIVQELSQVVANIGISLIKLKTECKPAPNWGGNLFQAHIQIAAPSDEKLFELQSALEKLADDLIVDFA
ncbi:glycine cleavage system protein R [Alginatibacterium sediminis]|nr:ACT domain-containing protein [Alginatibacterium sediminis]